jgi:putative SOS response-associated peptidase YedK
MDAPPHNLRPRYNVCPTDPVDVVTADDGNRELATMRWGLVPRWWSKPLKEMRVATFTARAETVESKPAFRDAFKRTRCLIPMSGYYERLKSCTMIITEPNEFAAEIHDRMPPS